MRFKGHFKLDHYRCGRRINRLKFNNGVTDQGLSSILAVNFLQGLQLTWWLGLIDAAGYSGLSNSDTLADHAGWDEWLDPSTNREPWLPAATTPGVITNASATVITVNATGDIKGIMIVDTSSLNVGVLWATALLPSVLSVNAADELRFFYEVQAERG